MGHDIRVGKVSSVDPNARTARVIFSDKADMVSGELKVLSNSPLITADITTGGEAWTVNESYSSTDRELGRGESYRMASSDNISAELSAKRHKANIAVYGWLPYVGQTVLCIMLPNGEGDGYIIGGVCI